MKTISLTQGQHAIVDDSDFEYVNSFKWCASKNTRGGGEFYAVRRSPSHRMMHRLILNAKSGQYVDHINHNTLDNRRSNIRLCSAAENGRNRRGANSNSVSGILGIEWIESRHKWAAKMRIGGKPALIGRYATKEEAIQAHASARRKHYGEFAGC